MKKVLAIIFCLVATNANASWYYLVNSDGNVVAKQNGPARPENLMKDNYVQIVSEDDMDVRVAEARNGKIVRHVKTSKENQADADLQASKDARKAARESAKAKLKTLNLTDDEIAAITGGN